MGTLAGGAWQGEPVEAIEYYMSGIVLEMLREVDVTTPPNTSGELEKLLSRTHINCKTYRMNNK